MSKKGILVLALGILLLLIGIVGYFATGPRAQQYETTLGDMYRSMDSSGQREYEGLKLAQLISILLMFTGGLMVLAEVVIYLRKPGRPAGRVAVTGVPYGPFYPAPAGPGPRPASPRIPPMLYCEKCGAKLVPGNRFCVTCGSAI